MESPTSHTQQPRPKVAAAAGRAVKLLERLETLEDHIAEAVRLARDTADQLADLATADDLAADDLDNAACDADQSADAVTEAADLAAAELPDLEPTARDLAGALAELADAR